MHPLSSNHLLFSLCDNSWYDAVTLPKWCAFSGSVSLLHSAMIRPNVNLLIIFCPYNDKAKVSDLSFIDQTGHVTLCCNFPYIIHQVNCLYQRKAPTWNDREYILKKSNQLQINCMEFHRLCLTERVTGAIPVQPTSDKLSFTQNC